MSARPISITTSHIRYLITHASHQYISISIFKIPLQDLPSSFVFRNMEEPPPLLPSSQLKTQKDVKNRKTEIPHFWRWKLTQRRPVVCPQWDRQRQIYKQGRWTHSPSPPVPNLPKTRSILIMRSAFKWSLVVILFPYSKAIINSNKEKDNREKRKAPIWEKEILILI